jgi:REP element-mobilizing transposase RayT
MGGYFVTVCAHQRHTLFGFMQDQEIRLSRMGQVVLDCWNTLPDHHQHIATDAFVIMPNHVHGILIIGDVPGTGAAGRAPTPRAFGPGDHGSLSTIVRSFKSASARQINLLRGTPGAPVWQRNYYEHVVRNEEDLLAIQQYILDNPARWAEDEENPGRTNPKRDTGP